MLELIANESEGTTQVVNQSLDELALEDARRMIAEDLKAEVDE